jgi:GT2 family glycosyltransferase
MTWLPNLHSFTDPAMNIRRLPVQFYNAYRLWRRRGTRVLIHAIADELNRNWGLRLPVRSFLPPLPDDECYRAWLARVEPLQEELQWQRVASKHLPFRPLISFLTPVYNPPPNVLRDTLNSVLAQTYDHWQLCLADASTDPRIRDVLREFAGRDPRVQVRFLERNEGISGNSNRCLEMAQGEFVAILDHDDTLSPHAVYEVVRELNRDDRIDLIYFDEDKLTADGKMRREPWFKPDWSPELLLSANYLMHSVMRASLVRQAGGFDPELEGAQDWGLALQVSLNCRRIVHLPKVLYHWRQLRTSAATGNLDTKPYARRAQVTCKQRHLAHLGFHEVVISSPGFDICQIRWAHPHPKASIIIPTKDKLELLKRCIATILKKTEYPDFEVVLVDTGSIQADTQQYYQRILAEDSRVRLVYFTEQFNYSRANNFGVRHAAGDVFVFLNNDTEVLEGTWLAELVQWSLAKGVGAVGGKLLYPNGSLQHVGAIFLQGRGPRHIFHRDPDEHANGPFGSVSCYRNYLAVTGACLAMSRSVFDKIGGFDEQFDLQYSDVDLCLTAAEHGYRTVYNPFVRLIHHENATHGGVVPKGDLLRVLHKMAPILFSEDPYYNRNLSPTSEIPAIVNTECGPPVESLNTMMKHLDLNLEVSLLPGTGAYPNLLATHHLNDISVVRFPPPDPCAGRLLFLSPGLQNAGVPLAFYHMATHLYERGYAVTVASPSPGPLRDAYDAAGVPVFINPLVAAAPYALSELFAPFEGVLAAELAFASAVCAAISAGKRPLWLLTERSLPDSLPEHGRAVATALPGAEVLLLPYSTHEEWLRRCFPGCAPHIAKLGPDADALNPLTTSSQRENGRPRVEQLADQLLNLGLGMSKIPNP